MDLRQDLNPTLKVENIFNASGLRVDIFAFAYKPGLNLSLRGTTESQSLRVTHPDVRRALLSGPQISSYFAPAPVDMNGLVCDRSQLGTHIRVDDFVTLWRGTNADAFYGLRCNEAFVMSSANCMLIIVRAIDSWGREIIIASHAGRNSLYDPNNPSRASVVDNIIRKLKDEGVNASKIKVWIGLSVSSGSHFEHRTDDERYPHNKALVEYARSLGPHCVRNNGTFDDPDHSQGWLDIKQMARCQFRNSGVPDGNIYLDNVCTHTDRNPDGTFTWGSHIRGANERNLVVVRVT